MAKRSIDLERPKLYSPASMQRIIGGSGGSVRLQGSTVLVDSNVGSTSSFRYDVVGSGIKSTQQINVDFSTFESHTFFGSAVVNTNVAFEKIINEYPFDGSRREIEAFVDSLSGFEKWVLDNFPTSVGYLNFSGSASTSTSEGTYIIVRDYAGYLYPSFSKKRTGENIIDPELKSLTIELQLFVPTQANGNEIICQKISGSNDGITLALSQSSSTTTCNVVFAASSASLILSASAPITKGAFNQVAAVFDRHPNSNNVALYVNSKHISSSLTTAEFGSIMFPTSPFIVGSGTQHDRMHSHESVIAFVPNRTFSGSIDELRVFHSARGSKDQALFANRAIFSSPDLKLYFKFNEPTGSIGNNSLVIDSSGNSLHSLISNFAHACRSTGSITTPMHAEQRSFNPVLFPAYDEVQAFNEDLLATASAYDALNPNLITRLVPAHYFQEGQIAEGLKIEEGTIGDSIDSDGPPGSLNIGSAQLFSMFLYVWARFFDEIKMSVDLFGSLTSVDYDKHGFTADQFLQFLARYYGFEMPAFFVDSTIEQFIDAQNIVGDAGIAAYSLQYVQNQLWRRILTNVGEIVRSKGTLHSVKSLLRSLGINPDSDIRIREFGGATQRSLEEARDVKQDITTMLNFSGTLATQASAVVDAHGVHASKPFLRSGFLSSSRQEPGFPRQVGAFVGVSPALTVSNAPADGLHTSGSWTFECVCRYPFLLTGSHPTTQSIVRMNVTGTAAGLSGSGGLVANLLAISGSGLHLYVAPGFNGSTHPVLSLPLTASDIMGGRLWNVSFGRVRSDAINAYVSSSYFIRAIRQEYGNIVESHMTAAFFNESGSDAGTKNVFEHASSMFNSSGSFLTIGSQSINVVSATFLNDDTVTAAARMSQFSGLLGSVRFWSKALSTNESYEHALNFRSIGTDDPLVNFNFNVTPTGSFEKLRLDVSLEQPLTRSDSSGLFTAFDFSQNNLHMSGSGFEASSNIMYAQRVSFSQLSPRFDEAASSNKVRVRSFKDIDNVNIHGGAIAPVYELPRSEIPNDDTRFSIDFSIADALDDDIVKIFATFDALDNAIGNPELMFSPDYPSLANLRSLYFNRLNGAVKMQRFFDFFKWFDSMLNVSTLIEQLIPRKTLFLGTNFVIESHMLERAKLEYRTTGMYARDTDKQEKALLISSGKAGKF